MISQTQHRVCQKLASLNINSTQPQNTFPQKNLYEVPTTLGKITIETTRFTQYIIIVVTYSGALKLDGYLQIAYPTPYVQLLIIQSDKPSVINIQKDEGQMDNQRLSQLLSKQLNCAVFLSFNLEQLNKGSEEELLTVLRKILIPQKKIRN